VHSQVIKEPVIVTIQAMTLRMNATVPAPAAAPAMVPVAANIQALRLPAAAYRIVIT